MLSKESIQVSAIASGGSPVTTVNATFSPQFLALLSEHLYSSPNKAFEELISNSWDADASQVYVRVPDDLNKDNAAIWILDNGASMDVGGMEQLWTIASSKKRAANVNKRKQIGKFGIGKLATYVLANELTYVCQSSDGKIRIVTMDYRRIDKAKSEHLEKLPLSVREISSIEDLEKILDKYEFGKEVTELVRKGIPASNENDTSEDEFGGPPVTVLDQTRNTWTLAILTELKDEGKGIQIGWIRRLLSTSLPLGNSITIDVNGANIKPSKSVKPIQKSWKIGPDLEFDSFFLDEKNEITIQKYSAPYPHIKIDGVGEITGTATLYESNIRGGKSDQLGESNGFFVNVLGRVINAEDNLFKLSDLNLSVLAQFRATIRVDELDKQISANREAIAESHELKVVRALLRKLFNLGRREYAKIEDKIFVDAGKSTKNDLGSIPVAPLTAVIERSLANDEPLPFFVKADNAEIIKKEKDAWLHDTKEDLSKSINTVEFREDMPQNSLVKYDLETRTIVINKNHPFAKENTHTTEQINTLKDSAVVDLLTNAYILNCGISSDLCNDIVEHKDRVLRLVAQIRRNSAAQIISGLQNWKTEVKPFEHIVGDALEYLGFSVERLGASGEPEGVATAYISPKVDDKINSYCLTYDAKSTKHAKAKTGNLNIAGLARHRSDYNAEYSLVVAPDFQSGALDQEANASQITPMTAKTLAKLVSITIGFGPINLEKMKSLFAIYNPQKVEEWVDEIQAEMESQSMVDIRILVAALEQLVTKNRMDILGCDSIALKYREIAKTDSRPTRTEIAQVFRGLSLIAPNAVFIDPIKGWDVFVFTQPSMLLQEIKRQTQTIPIELKLGAINDSTY